MNKNYEKDFNVKSKKQRWAMRKTNAYGLVSCLLGLTYIFGTQTTTVMALTETVSRVEEEPENIDTSPDTLSTDEVNSEEDLEKTYSQLLQKSQR